LCEKPACRQEIDSMIRIVRRIGELALAGALVVGALAVASHPTPVHAAATARAADDAVAFYRDPMGEALFSRVLKQDSMGMDYLPVTRAQIAPLLAKLPPPPLDDAATDPILFWRDPMGGTEISLAPKKDGMGMDFLPVRAADAIRLVTALDAAQPTQPAPANRRILYYRNPMGLADVSPTPKKDSMGMDYLPVYENDDADASVVKIAPGKIQRTGVRSEPARAEAIVSKVQVPGVIQLDERRIVIVATRSTAFIEKVANVTTGDLVRKGQTLLHLYSPEIAAALAQYSANPSFEGSRIRVLNLAVPPEVLAEIERTRKPPVGIAWPAPSDGIVLERTAIDGMKADAGAPLFRLADVSLVWALVDVSERDYSRLRNGQPVAVRARALPGRVFAGKVSQIYPQINRETRTVRVRVELANADLALRPDMYVEAEIDVGTGATVVTVPDNAVIDSGSRQLVILDRGEGRFEPREIKPGQRGAGRVEIREGVAAGDRVVTSANFLIDAESNLKAALKSFAPPEAQK
jgi:membrane fusion protein, copper/silver efflux system